MNRFIKLIVINVIFITLSSFLGIFQNGVTINADIPDVIEAGTEITVNVTINKGNQTGFARFQQELPFGFTAAPLNSAYADFSFFEQKVRFVWMSIPENSVISFSYKIIANERLTGEIDLQGRFSYSENNEPKSADMRTKPITITPSPNVPPERQVDINEYARVAEIEAAAAGSGKTVALRQQPLWMEEDKVFLVTLLINKDAAKQYAKVEEKTPEGFYAAGIDSKGGLFSYNNNNRIAQIIWMDMPTEPYFTVTYKLIPQDGANINQESLNINGEFSFMVNERTFTTPIIERREQLAGLNREQLNNILRDFDIQYEDTKPLIAETPKSPPTVEQTVMESKTPDKTSSPPSIETPTRQLSSMTSKNQKYLLASEPGIKYRVQIAAGRKEIDIMRYFRNYSLDNYTVYREEHEGWYKYSVGSYNKYKDARDYRVHLYNNTKVKDAFVSAYNNGKRITVQEALMALNDTWMR